MQNKPPINLGNNIFLIDGFDLGMPSRTGSYVLDEDELTIVETGPSPSVPYIVQGLKELGKTPEMVKYIIVTHIHLDHAGGAGVLLEQCPHAKVIVHPRGERHLIDPSKLAAGARAVYGDKFDALFDPIKAIPEDRLIVKHEGDTLKIGENRTLEFLDTPGHAKHHFSIYDPVSNGMFTGDTVGIRYEELEKDGIYLYLPTTSPNHFDPDAMLDSIDRIRKRNIDKIYFGHFSVTENVEEVYRQVSDWIPLFVKEGEKALSKGKDDKTIYTGLMNLINNHLSQYDLPENHPVYPILELDLQVSAMGIADYLRKKKR
ncbi:glyoxylase-like metal-dependent hydrolase (beta-lactamase superfamily II) [Scopulibacillus darangshiensis]|uniref:Glyoxylase-like metal-dependent hydrolase (Beta-lactamase superfamily II) n=1 Tax=Scopulibacillus darangshiensis TaxID=442528 RepID=A0A4R2P4M3_9BACL|nr:MBL fold metallo-hydrolase [Scopulibacillus darangshiensis]TCP28705.1 glyoxylase-like metal-dependent hydrolase (beta-lactamase superfamily II) [Scopulibacillus darangshiensis]